MKGKASRLWLLAAFFCVIGILLGVYSKYYFDSKEVYYDGLNIGESGLTFVTPPSTGSGAWAVPSGTIVPYTELGVAVMVDNHEGYSPEGTNAGYNAVKWYKDWMPTVADSDNAFYVYPGTSGVDLSGYDNGLQYGAYDAASGTLVASHNEDYGNAVIHKVGAANTAGGVFKPKLKELFHQGGMTALASWETVFTDPSYVTKAQQQWKYFVGANAVGIETRIRDYMGIGSYDLNNIAGWTQEQLEEGFLSYLDMLLLCRYALADSPKFSTTWTGIVNGYLSEGPGPSFSNYNLIIIPALQCGRTKPGGTGAHHEIDSIIMFGINDALEWSYLIPAVNNLGVHKGNKILAGYENTGGLDGYYKEWRDAIHNTFDSTGREFTAYPFSSQLGGLIPGRAWTRWFDAGDRQFKPNVEGMGYAESMWMTAQDGTPYYGKQLVLGLPLAAPPAGLLKHHFRVYWSNDGSNYFQTSGANVADTVAFVINIDCSEEDLPSWENILKTNDKFWLSFDLTSVSGNNETSSQRYTKNDKEGGQTTALNPPVYNVAGSNYSLKQKVEISREDLRKLIKGDMAYTLMYDRATNSQVINMGELQRFGYDLNVVVHYGKDASSAASCDTGWTGFTRDTSDGDREYHQVSVYREEDNPQKIKWYSSPEAYSEIKEGTVDYKNPTSHEAFEAMAGVPSTEMLYFASGGSEFIVELELERVEGEDGMRTYSTKFFGTECEFKHQDAFWEMVPYNGEAKYQEHVTDTNIAAPSPVSPTAALQQGEEIISKFLVADKTGQDTAINYGSKTPVQWYKWAVPGSGGGTNSVSGNFKLNGHTHDYLRRNAGADQNMAGSTITATWRGTIKNVNGPNGNGTAPNTPYVTGFKEENWSCACTGDGGAPGTFNETDTSWEVTDYHAAVDQAKAWAKAFEETNKSYTAKMLADSDDFTRVWRIGDATIQISFSGGTSNQGSGARPAGSYTTANVDTAKKPGDMASFGYNHSFTEGSPGKAGECPVDPKTQQPKHEGEGSKCQGSSISNAGDISYTITVTFSNGTFDAHELCGPCCRHDLPGVSDVWLQKMKYDYARLNQVKVYKIYRSYLEGGDLEEITFADYKSDEDNSKEASEHMMYSGPIYNYTVDTGAFSTDDRFFDLDVTDKDRARQVISAKEQSQRHNGTDTIVAAINQGDPNIFYNIGMMHSVQDDLYRSYAEEVDTGHTSFMNSFAGRVRYSFSSQSHHSWDIEEYSQRGDFTAQNTGSVTDYYGGYNADYPLWTGSRSNKCDGQSETISGSNPIYVKSNGHQKPTVQVRDAELFAYANAGKPTDIPNYSNGLLYTNNAIATWNEMDPANYEASSRGTKPFYMWTFGPSGGTWYYTDDEYWMGVTTTPDSFTCTSLENVKTTVETNGGGQIGGGKYTYPDWNATDNTGIKTKYTGNSIDAIDYMTEEYHRFRWRRNQRNTLYVISDMLILQTSSGDQPVLYHWKSQTKRLQQHYDYTAADVDPQMAQFDSEMTGNNITLTETLEDMWINQLNGKKAEKETGPWASATTRTVNGWKTNNVGVKQGINVGGYLGLYDQPESKYSSANKVKVATLFDMYDYNIAKQGERVQGNDYGEITNTLPTFNELAVRWPVMMDYYYRDSPHHSSGGMLGISKMSFGANKTATSDFADNVHTGTAQLGFGYVNGTNNPSEFYTGFSHGTRGPSMVWRYETTVDNPNPDMYKASPNARFTGFGETGTNNHRGAEWRMDQPAQAMRIVTDKIQQDPTNPNGKYDTGEATQTYMLILDWPNRDVANMNFVDIRNGGGGNPGRYANTKAEAKKSSKYKPEAIDVVDKDFTATHSSKYENLIDKSGPNRGSLQNIAYSSSNKATTYGTIDGYKIDAPYSKNHDKINDIVVHTPVSVQHAVLRHNETGDQEEWYADTRTNFEDLSATSLADKFKKLEVCSGDPDTCEFKVLKCAYGDGEGDVTVFSTDFDTNISSNGRTISNLATADGLIQSSTLPDGFTITKGEPKEVYNVDKSVEDGANVYDTIYVNPITKEEFYDTLDSNGNVIRTAKQNMEASNNAYLKCFGTRWSIPLSGLKIDSNTKKVSVEFDYYMDDSKTRATMPVSFYSYDFYIPGGVGEGTGTFNTGNGWEKAYNNTELYNNRVKMKLVFSFDDAKDSSNAKTLKNSQLYINGKLVNSTGNVNQSSLNVSRIGTTLNIGSWGIDGNYPAQFYIDNLRVTKLSGERMHTNACYAYVQECEMAQSFVCEVAYTYTYEANRNEGNTSGYTDRPYLFKAPVSGTYKAELWGAAGGGSRVGINLNSAGGPGGYSEGYIYLQKDEEIMIYPGGAGSRSATTTTGKEYCWILTDGCGNYTNFAANAVDTISGVNYINSVTGKTEKTNWNNVPCIWSNTVPSGYTCSNHSVSVAIDSATGQMVSRLEQTEWNYSYTGGVQAWVAPRTGTYKLEAWGASGGGTQNASSGSHGGKGGYSAGNISVNAGDRIYIYVGGQGTASTALGTGGGYNGGGHGGPSGYGGGGMTHFTTSGSDSIGTSLEQVLDPTAGTLLGSDDDSGNGLSARLSITLDPGTYLFTVGRYSGSNSGSYPWEIRRGGSLVASGTDYCDEGAWSDRTFDKDCVHVINVASKGTYVFTASANGGDPCVYVTTYGTRTNRVDRVNFNTSAALLIAGGGGGSDNAGGTVGDGDDGSGGAGGGLTAENAKVAGSYQAGTAGTQSTGYKQGLGASATTATDTGGAGGGWYGGNVTNHNNGGAGGGSGYISSRISNGTSTVGGNGAYGNGRARITSMTDPNTNTWAGAGFNGGGTSGVNGYGGGGGTDIRRLSNNSGGLYILNTASATGVYANAKKMMAESGTLTYGPYDSAQAGTYQVDIYGTGLARCTFDVYDNNYAGRSSHIIANYNELLDLKVSPTHVSFYFNLPIDSVKGNGGGLEVRVHHSGISGYAFNASYITRLEDRIIVAGGGGGSDDGGSGAGGVANDGSGGIGGGDKGGASKVDGAVRQPGVALTAELQATVNSIKNSEGAWKAIEGVSSSGCGLGGSQTSGYALGRGESVSYTTDTGGAGGGYYGGYVTNHNNGGAGGGSGYISGSVENGTTLAGVNYGEGKVRLQLVEHENETTYQQAYGYTGSTQTWTAPEDGEYRFELWGAQGGMYTSGYAGGAGGYASAVLTLKKGQTFNLNVGRMGYSYPQNHSVGAPFGGGGQGYGGGGDGGGATDVRYGSTKLIVAGGGGGSDLNSKGGYGGDEVGGRATGTVNTASSPATGGTQTSGGRGSGASGGLGIGGGPGNASYDGGGGGGGYYGGASGYGGQSAGGGGSSYINKTFKINGQNLAGGKMISGAGNQPNKTDRKAGIQVGNTGHGAIRITRISRSHDASCKSISTLNNVHRHNVNCLYEYPSVIDAQEKGTKLFSPILKAAVEAYANGSDSSGSELSALLSSTVFGAVRGRIHTGMSDSEILNLVSPYVGQQIPGTVGGYLNPIYVCDALEPGQDGKTDSIASNKFNTHEHTAKCAEVNKILKCTEPHHMNKHYETADEHMKAALQAAQNQKILEYYSRLQVGQIFTEDLKQQAIAEATAQFNAEHRDTVWKSCYEACNDDSKHHKTNTTTTIKDHEIGDHYINTDEYFDIYFPNVGDFEDDPTLHGISSTTTTRGMGYTDNMDTGRFVYPKTSQNFVYEYDEERLPYPQTGTVSWVRERYVKFNFDVLFYRAETGVWEEYKANTWIELPVEGTEDNVGLNKANNGFNDTDDSCSGSFKFEGKPTGKDKYGNDYGWKELGHPLYHFYCLMNNNEQAAAKIEFESEAINCDNSKGKYAYKDNYGYTGDWVYETITGEKLYQKQRDRNDRVVYNKTSNHKNDNDNPTMDTNKTRRTNMTALHGAHITKNVDVVGRIGNIAITSTTDIRFANFFKRTKPDGEGAYLINGVVKEVYDTIQRDYLSWHWNDGRLAYDVRHRGVSAKTAMYNTWGSAMWKGATSCTADSASSEKGTSGNIDNHYGLDHTVLDCNNHAADVVAGHNINTKKDPSGVPLSSDRNNLQVYRNELLKPGYTVNYEITTSGNYQNKLQIKPYFYILDLDKPGSAKLTPIDVYMLTDDEYKGINFFGAADGLPLKWSDGTTSAISEPEIQEMLNNYILDLDWKNEKDMRMYTQMEEKLTQLIRDNYMEAYMEPGAKEASLRQLTIPQGDFFKLGNLQSQVIGKEARTFIGTRYTMHENFRHTSGPDMFSATNISNDLHDTNVWSKISDLEYTYQTQRWHLKLGLPSSAVFTIVENGKHYKPLDEKIVDGKKVKAFEEVKDGNYAIVMTANIKAMGDIWNLYYTQEANNGSVKIDNKTFNFDSDLYNFTTGNKSDSQVVIALYDNDTTSEVDVDTISTH